MGQKERREKEGDRWEREEGRKTEAERGVGERRGEVEERTGKRLGRGKNEGKEIGENEEG